MTQKDFLERFPILDSAPEEKKEALLRYFATAPRELLEYFTQEQIPENTTFVREGETARYVFFVAKGSVRAVDYRFPGVEYEFMQFNKVYAMGAMEILLERKEYVTTLKTNVPCVILRCEREHFAQWLLSDLVALRHESKLMGEYLLEQGRLSRAYLFLPGPERLAQIFIHRYEACGAEGILSTDGNQQILANETGFNIKTVARSLKTLTDSGLISRKGRQILINATQYGGLKELVGTIVDPEKP